MLSLLIRINIIGKPWHAALFAAFQHQRKFKSSWVYIHPASSSVGHSDWISCPGYVDIGHPSQMTILLVHGWPADGSTWARQIADLQVNAHQRLSCSNGNRWWHVTEGGLPSPDSRYPWFWIFWSPGWPEVFACNGRSRTRHDVHPRPWESDLRRLHRVCT